MEVAYLPKLQYSSISIQDNTIQYNGSNRKLFTSQISSASTKRNEFAENWTNHLTRGLMIEYQPRFCNDGKEKGGRKYRMNMVRRKTLACIMKKVIRR
jgi:hypothetical protein